MTAFFCRTPIHIFRAIQFKMQLLSQEKCDIYIFDTFPSAKKMFERIKEYDLFADVYYICDSDYLRNGRADALRTTILPSSFKKILIKKEYKQIFLFNIYGAFNELIFNVLKRNNEQLIVNMVEDGPSIYHIEEYKDGTIRKLIYPILNIKSYLKNIDCWWFSKPELMEALYDGIKKEIPHINKQDKKFINIINYVFGYKSNALIDNAEIIIMEECYWSDGLLKTNGDFNLFLKIKESFSDNTIVVKLHPRTRENRFGKEFNVVEANGIPWEVYALNMNMDNKILISLSCATMISTKLLYNEETYSLLLYPIIEDSIKNTNNGSKYLTEERKQKIDSQANLYDRKDKFYKASDIDEALKIVKRWIEEITLLSEEKKI